MELLSQTLTLNSSNTSENSDLVCSDWFRKREVIWYWVMSTLSILSLLGNGLLITIIFKNHKLRTTMNLFVVNVAISDMCFPVYSTFAMTTMWNRTLWQDGAFGHFTCKFTGFFQGMSVIGSLYSLVCIAIDRFYAVVLPLKVKNITFKVRGGLLISVWILCLVFSCPLLYAHNIIRVNNLTYCQRNWGYIGGASKIDDIYMTCVFIVVWIVPITILVILYSVIIFTLRKRNNGKDFHLSSLNENQKEERRRQRKNITKMCITVLVVFVVSWCPIYMFFILQKIQLNGGTILNCNNNKIELALTIMPFIEIAINPWIYPVFSRSYRHGFASILWLCKNKTRLIRSYSRSKAQQKNKNTNEVQSSQSVNSEMYSDTKL